MARHLGTNELVHQLIRFTAQIQRQFPARQLRRQAFGLRLQLVCTGSTQGALPRGLMQANQPETREQNSRGSTEQARERARSHDAIADSSS